MSIFTRKFWLDTIERSAKTWAQSAAALLVGNGVGLLDVDWVSVASVSTLAALVSVLTSIGSGYVGDDSPSLVD
jgi:hypothetical protein